LDEEYPYSSEEAFEIVKRERPEKQNYDTLYWSVR
jgi:hypothetical protein